MSVNLSGERLEQKLVSLSGRMLVYLLELRLV